MYEQIINTVVTGTDQVEKAAASTDRLASRTKLVDEVTRSFAASSEKLAGKLLEIERAEIRLEQLREQHRMQTERLAAATDKQTASQEKLNGAMRGHVTDVQAASAAIRGFEGNLPIRAVEQFATKILGLGPAMQAIFPIVGAVAMLELLDKGAEKLGIHLNFWNQIKEAQKQSTDEIRTAAREYEALIEKVKILQKQERRRALIANDPKNGATLADQADATDTRFDAESERRKMRLLEQEIAAVRKIINLPAGGTFTRDEAKLAGLAGMTGMEDGNYPSAFEIQAGEKLLPGLEAQLHAGRARIDAIQQQQQAEQKKVDEDIAKKREEAERKALEATRKREAENKQLDEYRKSVDDKTFQNPIARAIRDAQFKIGDAPDRLKGDYAQTASEAIQAAARNEQQKDAKQIIKDWENGPSFDRDAKFLKERLSAGARSDESTLQEMQKQLRDMRGAMGERAEGDLRNLRSGERRYSSLARVSAQLAGTSQRDQIDSEAGERIRFANQEYELQLKINFAKLDGFKREEADKAALDAKNEKIFEAQMQREQAILEMTLRVKQEFERNTVGLIHAAASGHLGGFVKGRLESLGDEVLAKAAGELFKVILAKARPKTISIRDVIGGAAKDDPNVVATDDNTRATDDNTRAIRDLTSVLAGGAVVAAGAGGAAAGYPTIGFPNGSNGPGVIGGASSSINYGFPGSGGSSNGKVSGGAVLLAAPVAYKGISDISKGGARNAVSGVGEVAAAAALVDPEPVSKLVLAGVAVVAGIVSSLMGDPGAIRANQISQNLKYGQYISPASMKASMSIYGGYADYDRFGGIRDSSLSPYPVTVPGYLDPFGSGVVPGRSSSAFGGGPTVHVNVQTLDARSFRDNSGMVADAVQHALQTGRATGLQETLRSM